MSGLVGNNALTCDMNDKESLPTDGVFVFIMPPGLRLHAQPTIGWALLMNFLLSSDASMLQLSMQVGTKRAKKKNYATCNIFQLSFHFWHATVGGWVRAAKCFFFFSLSFLV